MSVEGAGNPSGTVAVVSARVPSVTALADAHLIAAAPDLLAACQTALAYIEDDLGPCDVNCGCPVLELRAAIAKATGHSRREDPARGS